MYFYFITFYYKYIQKNSTVIYMNSLYESKYLKYKQKYIEYKIQHGGISPTNLVSSIPQFIAVAALIPRKKLDCKNQSNNDIINETTKEVLTDGKIRLRRKIRQSLCYNGIYNNKLFTNKIIVKLNNWVNSLTLAILEANIYNGEFFSNIKIQYFKDILNGIIVPTGKDIYNITNKKLYKNNSNIDDINNNNIFTKDYEKHALQATKTKIGQNIRALLQMAGVTTFKTHIQVLIDDIISYIDCANNYGGYKVKNMFKQQINHLEHSVKKKIKKLENYNKNSKNQECDKVKEYINLTISYKKYDDLKKHYNYNIDSNDFDYVNMECFINLLTKENRVHLGNLIRIYLLTKYPENKVEIIASINNNINNSNKDIQTLCRLVYLLENIIENCGNIDKQFII